MQDEHLTPHRRRQLVALGLTTFLSLLAARFFILPWLSSQPIPDLTTMLAAILDGFIVAVASALITAAALGWLFPMRDMAEITTLRAGPELKRQLHDDLQEVKQFYYKGHTGKWTRSVTLPTLAATVGRTPSSIDVHLVLIDPRNDLACRQLAYLDASWNPRIDLASQVVYIKKQLLATVLAAQAWQGDEPRLKVAVGLHSEFSLFRIDLTDRAAILTRSGPGDLALRYSHKSDFYRSFRDEVRVSFERSRHLPRIENRISINRLTKDDAHATLVALGLDPTEIFGGDVDVVEDIVKIVRDGHAG